ncbi:unnamed protein product [Medioppia subpectinata]|uniref:Uncharacterized protein n=1 Tax=Medioppia subpectinata TaxID=1979941 RepID=A0A7R9Q5F6_9ACAR|nr:unnamed protein product [Medioppia subpectinata]CAG2112730.1 unnamed protein product [Medioppia subpectinata]
MSTENSKVDTDKVTKVVECLNNFKNERLADIKVDKTFQKECTRKAGDMSKFKKVDLTKLEMRFGWTQNKWSADMKALGEKLDKTFHTKCMGKAGDISKFKKVDLTKHDLKQMMIESCDEAYQKCSSELVESSKTLQDELIQIHKSVDKNEHKKYKKCTLDGGD